MDPCFIVILEPIHSYSHPIRCQSHKTQILTEQILRNHITIIIQNLNRAFTPSQQNLDLNDLSFTFSYLHICALSNVKYTKINPILETKGVRSVSVSCSLTLQSSLYVTTPTQEGSQQNAPPSQTAFCHTSLSRLVEENH